MISTICDILSSLLSLLPNSWVQGVVSELEDFSTFLGFLNFFVPFDVCAGIFQLWLAAFTLFLIYSVASDKLWKFLL